MSFYKIPEKFTSAERFLFAAATGNVPYVKKQLSSLHFDPTVLDASENVAKEVFEKRRYAAYSALQFACFKNQKEVVTLLLQDDRIRGTVNHPIHQIGGKPLLHILACRIDSLEIIKELLHAGARTDLLDSSFMTPFMNAAFNVNKAAIELFVNHEINYKRACLNLFLVRDVIGIVLSYDPTFINIGDDTGRTPLYYAILMTDIPKEEAKSSVELLLRHRADPLHPFLHSLGLQEETILEHSKKGKNQEVVKLLEDRAMQLGQACK